jgi:hypothetical protein
MRAPLDPQGQAVNPMRDQHSTNNSTPYPLSPGALAAQNEPLDPDYERLVTD